MSTNKDNDEIVSSKRDIQIDQPGSPLMSVKNSKEKVEAVRNLIINNPGKVLRLSDFRDALDTTAAPYYVYNLMREGRVVRHKVFGEKGHQYSYTWVDQPDTQVESSNKLSENGVNTLMDLLQEWQQVTLDGSNDSELAQQHLGATKFVNWIKSSHMDTKQSTTAS